MRVPRAGPLGRTHKTLLRYCEYRFTLDPGLVTAHQKVYSANGMWDPNFSGGGHQPLGFDQLMAMYNHYTVIGAKIAVRMFGIDSTYEGLLSIHLQSNSSAPPNIEQLIENGSVAYKFIGSRDSGTTAALTLKCNPAKYLGRSKPLSDPQLKGTATANPDEQVYFVISADAPSGTDISGMYGICSIEYLAVFHEPKLLAQS